MLVDINAALVLGSFTAGGAICGSFIVAAALKNGLHKIADTLGTDVDERLKTELGKIRAEFREEQQQVTDDVTRLADAQMLLVRPDKAAAHGVTRGEILNRVSGIHAKLNGKPHHTEDPITTGEIRQVASAPLGYAARVPGRHYVDLPARLNTEDSNQVWHFMYEFLPPGTTAKLWEVCPWMPGFTLYQVANTGCARVHGYAFRPHLEVEMPEVLGNQDYLDYQKSLQPQHN